MPALSAREAARRAAVSDKTIRNAINAGELPARRGPDGAYLIDAADLTAWATARSTRTATARSEPRPEPAAATVAPLPPADATPHLSAALELLRETLATLQADQQERRAAWDAERARLLADLERERQERADAQDEARRLRLLPVHVPSVPRAEPWWKFWRR